ncbi:hypothetical protein HK405_005013, partial [Cladochytrium tenue]
MSATADHTGAGRPAADAAATAVDENDELLRLLLAPDLPSSAAPPAVVSTPDILSPLAISVATSITRNSSSSRSASSSSSFGAADDERLRAIPTPTPSATSRGEHSKNDEDDFDGSNIVPDVDVEAFDAEAVFDRGVTPEPFLEMPRPRPPPPLPGSAFLVTAAIVKLIPGDRTLECREGDVVEVRAVSPGGSTFEGYNRRTRTFGVVPTDAGMPCVDENVAPTPTADLLSAGASRNSSSSDNSNSGSTPQERSRNRRRDNQGRGQPLSSGSSQQQQQPQQQRVTRRRNKNSDKKYEEKREGRAGLDLWSCQAARFDPTVENKEYVATLLRGLAAQQPQQHQHHGRAVGPALFGPQVAAFTPAAVKRARSVVQGFPEDKRVWRVWMPVVTKTALEILKLACLPDADTARKVSYPAFFELLFELKENGPLGVLEVITRDNVNQSSLAELEKCSPAEVHNFLYPSPVLGPSPATSSGAPSRPPSSVATPLDALYTSETTTPGAEELRAALELVAAYATGNNSREAFARVGNTIDMTHLPTSSVPIEHYVFDPATPVPAPVTMHPFFADAGPRPFHEALFVPQTPVAGFATDPLLQLPLLPTAFPPPPAPALQPPYFAAAPTPVPGGFLDSALQTEMRAHWVPHTTPGAAPPMSVRPRRGAPHGDLHGLGDAQHFEFGFRDPSGRTRRTRWTHYWARLRGSGTDAGAGSVVPPLPVPPTAHYATPPPEDDNGGDDEASVVPRREVVDDDAEDPEWAAELGPRDWVERVARDTPFATVTMMHDGPLGRHLSLRRILHHRASSDSAVVPTGGGGGGGGGGGARRHQQRRVTIAVSAVPAESDDEKDESDHAEGAHHEFQHATTATADGADLSGIVVGRHGDGEEGAARHSCDEECREGGDNNDHSHHHHHMHMFQLHHRDHHSHDRTEGGEEKDEHKDGATERANDRAVVAAASSAGGDGAETTSEHHSMTRHHSLWHLREQQHEPVHDGEGGDAVSGSPEPEESGEHHHHLSRHRSLLLRRHGGGGDDEAPAHARAVGAGDDAAAAALTALEGKTDAQIAHEVLVRGAVHVSNSGGGDDDQHHRHLDSVGGSESTSQRFTGSVFVRMAALAAVTRMLVAGVRELLSAAAEAAPAKGKSAGANDGDGDSDDSDAAWAARAREARWAARAAGVTAHAVRAGLLDAVGLRHSVRDAALAAAAAAAGAGGGGGGVPRAMELFACHVEAELGGGAGVADGFAADEVIGLAVDAVE